MKHVAIRVLLPAFLTAACDSANTPDPAADRQAIAAATAQFQAAENAGSVDQFRSFFAEDLVMMGARQATSDRWGQCGRPNAGVPRCVRGAG